jgi:transcriptional regulator with XRE-family HTH domain
MSFGARLAAARKDAGLTQADLGLGLGTDGADASKSVVYGWEKDQHYPRVDQLMLICRKLRVSADFLLFGDEVVVNPKVEAAKQVVDALTDEERLALFAAIHQPAVPEDKAARHLPLPPEFTIKAKSAKAVTRKKSA